MNYYISKQLICLFYKKTVWVTKFNSSNLLIKLLILQLVSLKKVKKRVVKVHQYHDLSMKYYTLDFL